MTYSGPSDEKKSNHFGGMKATKLEKTYETHSKNTLNDMPAVCQEKIGFIQKFLRIQHGNSLAALSLDQATQCVFRGLALRLTPYKTASPFDRRVTALTWHPRRSGVLAAGSHGGEIIWWDFNQAGTVEVSIPGIGAGGSITAMHFHKKIPNFIYTASMTGKIMQDDFEGRQTHCFLETHTLENWFTAMDLHPQKDILVAGDMKGALHMIDSNNGTQLWMPPKKVHKNKLLHVEFHPLQPDLLVTSSIDYTAKLWDMRMFEKPLCVLQHKKGVNSACFNSSGNLLLTTDQHSEIRVYSGPTWHSHISIPQPHRHFQHLTPIKASWHPCLDVVVVGRYPDDNFRKNDKRSIDFFDGQTGQLQFQLLDPCLSGIISLNKFNLTGDVLASAMGYQVVIWTPKDEDEQVSFGKSDYQKSAARRKQPKTPTRTSDGGKSKANGLLLKKKMTTQRK